MGDIRLVRRLILSIELIETALSISLITKKPFIITERLLYVNPDRIELVKKLINHIPEIMKKISEVDDFRTSSLN